MLALVHMEGHEHYSSCSLSSNLFSQVLQRKNQVFYSQQVDKFFDGEILEPMMAFTEAAFLGRQDAAINSIALMDKFGQRVLSEKKSLD